MIWKQKEDTPIFKKGKSYCDFGECPHCHKVPYHQNVDNGMAFFIASICTTCVFCGKERTYDLSKTEK